MENKLLFAKEKEIQNTNTYMPSKKVLSALADHFQVFSDATRLKIISILSLQPLCVSDIAKLSNLNQTTVSHQLKLLRDNQIVCQERKGKVIFYRLHNKLVDETMLIGANYVKNFSRYT